MLIGEYSHAIDQKGRVIFPSKLREDLGEQIIITRGLDGCLAVYANDVWEGIQKQLAALPMSKSRSIPRYMFASAAVVEPDKQGRIVIPQNLRDYAALTKDVVFIGAGNRVEIWDRDRWAEITSSLTSDAIAAAMDELGF